MPLDFNTGIHNTKIEPMAAKLAILPPPYVWCAGRSQLANGSDAAVLCHLVLQAAGTHC